MTRADHSGVAGEPEATAKEASEINSPATPTPIPAPDPVKPAAAILAGEVVVSDEMVRAFYAAFYRVECTAEMFHVADAYRAGLAAAAPLIAAQALRSAYWKLREHASQLRSTEVYRRCAERAEHEQGDSARDYQRYRWLEATARGIEDGARDLAELLDVEECEIEPRADDLERGTDWAAGMIDGACTCDAVTDVEQPDPACIAAACVIARAERGTDE